LIGAGDVPEIRKIAALLGLRRLDGAIVAVEEDAFVVGLFDERQPAAVPRKAGELLDEIRLAEFFEGGNPGDFFRGQPHLSRPSATGRATLAFEKDRHDDKDNAPRRFRQDHGRVIALR